jgi:F-type H+-transporting ATPase subunit b
MSLSGVSTISSIFTQADGSSFAEGGVNVDLDASFVVQIALFVVLMLVLKPLLFDPMMRLFEEREERIDRTIEKARKTDEASAKALAKYEAILAKAREAGSAERDQIRAQGAKKEAEVTAAVRSQTAATVEQGRAAIANEAKEARAKLQAEAAGLGRAIASRVLGREVTQ